MPSGTVELAPLVASAADKSNGNDKCSNFDDPTAVREREKGSETRQRRVVKGLLLLSVIQLLASVLLCLRNSNKESEAQARSKQLKVPVPADEAEKDEQEELTIDLNPPEFEWSTVIDNDNNLIVVEHIPLNPTSVWAEDILGIAHIPSLRKIVVTFQRNARCPRPYLMGRISGPALFLIQNWTFCTTNQSETLLGPYHAGPTKIITNCTTTMEGTYDIPTLHAASKEKQSTSFFIEILGLLCQDIYYQLKKNVQQNSTEEVTNWIQTTHEARVLLQYPMAGACMENSRHHRLTHHHANISIPVMSSSSSSNNNNGKHDAATTTTLGTWYWNNRTATPEPMHTRWQPTQCFFARQYGKPTPPDCVKHISVDRYQPYDFAWSNNGHNNHPVFNLSHVLQQPSSRGHTICFVGASHAGSFYRSTARLGFVPKAYQALDGEELERALEFQRTINPHNVSAGKLEAQYPADVNVSHLQEQGVDEMGCTRFVIANGQWPGSFDHAHPDNLWDYYFAVKQMVTNVQQWAKANNNKKARKKKKKKRGSNNDDVRFYLRSIHYNPLGNPIQNCPPTDWRNPVVIEGYNAILQQVAREHDVPFLDTNADISGPLWDAAPDWCHLSDKTIAVETIFIAAKVLSEE